MNEVNTNKQLRVLFIGHCNHIYIGYLNNVIKSNFSNSKTGVIDLNHPGGVTQEMKGNYDYVVSSKFEVIPLNSYISKATAVISCLKRLSFRYIIVSILKLNFRTVLKQCLSNYYSKQRRDYNRQIIINFNPTHIHVHYLNKSNLSWLDYVKADCKIVLTFWGSDLMTTVGGVDEYIIQYNALRKADVITTQTIDLRTILLSKFGQELLSKVSCMTFDPLKGKRKILNELRNKNRRTEIRSKYNIEKDKICIQVGYSASSSQNHLPVLKAIDSLPDEIRNSIVLFMPLSYGKRGEYVNELLSFVSEFDLNVIPITNYLTDLEIMEITSMCELFISVRDNDALNAAMAESLYVNNIVITGSWLPYCIYLKKGIYFEMVDSIDEVAIKLRELIINWEVSKSRTSQNTYLMEEIYDPLAIDDKWKTLYVN